MHVLGSWRALAALTAVALAALTAVALAAPPAEAQTAVRKPSVAVSAPGVLMIYTAKGGDSPGCTSTVEYKTRSGSPQSVNVTLGNTNQKGDHYRFTNAELTPGQSYQFRVQHTAGTNVDACQPHNTWSDWSNYVTFKAPANIPNIGAVSVTAKTATGHGDTTGSETTTVARAGWVALHFEPVNGGVFPHSIGLQACSRKNSVDVDANDCHRDGDLFGSAKRFDIKRGAREAWHWFEVDSTEWANNNTINLRFRTISGNHKYWQWETPIAKCWTKFGAFDPCKRLRLTAKTNVSDSEPNTDSSPPPPIESEHEQQSDQPPDQQSDHLGFVPDAAVVADVRGYAAETDRGSVHVERWQRVLVGLGVESYAGLTPMSASEAQVFADYGWSRWVPVVAQLQAAEAAQQTASQQQQADDAPSEYTPPAGLVADVRGYAAETDRGSVHVERWQRVLVGLGVESYAGLTAMSASEAQVFADYGWARWIPAAAELAKAEAAQ